MNPSIMPGVCELLVVRDSAEEVLELVVGHVARPDKRARELDDGPHDHQEPAVQWRCRVKTYRDAGWAEPGSERIFCSVSGSENQILGIFWSKDTFFLILKILFEVLLDTETVSGSCLPIHIFHIGPNPGEKW